MSRRFGPSVTSAIVAGLLLGAAAIASTPHIAVADKTCGARTNPCPMQKWMRTKLVAANEAGDMRALALALDKAAKLAPDPSWNGSDPDQSWDAIANVGAAAARANDAAKVKSACKACHDAWKDKYKESFRTRPIAG